jgi:serine/threonine protein kinase
MSQALAGHPDREQLARFRLGTLSPEEVEDIASHVAGCTPCCRSLKQLPDDSLVGLVRQAAHCPTPPDGDAEAQPERAAWPECLPADLVAHPRYEVLELLGVGGMGTVYKARHRLMDRLVALKVIHRRLMDRPGVVERFRREVRAAACLLHPNIVTAYDAEQAVATHFLVMEFVEGVTLAQSVAERGPLPVAGACAAVRQAALGLQHAHEHGMVHRDIKPHNLMRTGDGQIKVLDFGLARFASEVGPVADLGETGAADLAAEDGSMTTAGMVLGTADYLAPEQAGDPHAADIRADVYGLGCTLVFLLSGQPPSPEGPLMQTHTPPERSTPGPADTPLPPALRRVIDRMLARDPTQRYQTPAEVADALEPFSRPQPARSASPPRRRARPARRAGRAAAERHPGDGRLPHRHGQG